MSNYFRVSTGWQSLEHKTPVKVNGAKVTFEARGTGKEKPKAQICCDGLPGQDMIFDVKMQTGNKTMTASLEHLCSTQDGTGWIRISQGKKPSDVNMEVINSKNCPDPDSGFTPVALTKIEIPEHLLIRQHSDGYESDDSDDGQKKCKCCSCSIL